MTAITENVSIKSMPHMAYEEQQQITRLCVRCALLLMQHGAESASVVDLTKRLGIGLGVSSIACSISFNAVTLTTIYDCRCITTTRDTINQGINVSLLIQIQKIVNHTETKKRNTSLLSATQQAFDNLDRTLYPAWLVAIFVGGSCSGFAYLNGGSLTITGITFIAGAFAMLTRIFLSKHYFNVFITVIVTAFIASLIGATTYYLDSAYIINHWFDNLDIKTDADIAVASSVLLLVPSFPIINALSDILKGYLNMGLGRLVFAFMLTFSACVGIVMALILLQIQQWGV